MYSPTKTMNISRPKLWNFPAKKLTSCFLRRWTLSHDQFQYGWRTRHPASGSLFSVLEKLIKVFQSFSKNIIPTYYYSYNQKLRNRKTTFRVKFNFRKSNKHETQRLQDTAKYALSTQAARKFSLLRSSILIIAPKTIGENSAYWSSFAAATLPFPPQLVSLCEEDRKLKHNYRDTLVNITTRIREMNRGDNHPHIPTDMGCSYHATQQSGRTR